jgi:PTH1 family peptidyl-tRNA hydrolase
MSASLLLVGLGNPGEKYARQRHNVGFMAVDTIAEAHRFGPTKSKFKGEAREGLLGSAKALILKPLTYMNDSGASVGAAMRYLKLSPGEVVVFHDELDLAPGKVKAKIGGGTAGHNGLRSIDAHIGPDFRRVRIGIGHPGLKDRVHAFVLGDFAKADREWLDPLLRALGDAAPALAESDAKFTSALALKLHPPRPKPAATEATQKPEKTAAKPSRDSGDEI